MKLAISGKGGVGKTTLAVLVGRRLKEEGYKVILVDADPDSNLADALGYHGSITPISQLKELIEERTGVSSTFRTFFKLNPKVDDIPDRFCVDVDGMKVMVMGSIQKGGSGCVCPESVFLKALLDHLVVDRGEAVIMDMEAGIEHLGRATARSVDYFIVVVEPGKRSVETAYKVKEFAKDLGIGRCYVVGNKVRSQKDLEFIKSETKGFDFLGYIPYHNLFLEADMFGEVPKDIPPDLKKNIDEIIQKLLSKEG